MFVAGSDDQIVNNEQVVSSCLHLLVFLEPTQIVICNLQVQGIQELASEAGHTGCEYLHCPGLGHIINPPFDPPTTYSNNPLFPKDMYFEYGGSDIVRHVRGQQQVWNKTLDFLRRTLA